MFKSIIFTVLALIILTSGAISFEYFQEKIVDSTWKIVALKIVIAIALIVFYGLALKWFAGIYHIEWKGN